MRILFDHQCFSLQVTGGISRYWHELVKYFNQMQDVSTITQLGWATTVWPLEEVSKPRGQVLHWGPRLVRSGVGTYLINEVAILGACNLVRPRVEIYHNTLYRFMPTIRARAYVATHHDCTLERFPHLFREASIVMKAKRQMLKRADLVICITAASREDLHYFLREYDRARTIVLTNGAAALPRSAEAAAEVAKRMKRPFLLYVGTRFAYKNFSALLRAFAALGLQRQYDLLAIGGGKFSEKENQEVAALALTSSLVSVPLASAEFLAEAYAAATAFGRSLSIAAV